MNFNCIQVKSSAYFELHSSVQAALGISHALDVDGSKLRELSFLLIDGVNIFREILQFGMTSESKHIRQASEEIVLYILKSEKTLGQKMWKSFIEKVLKPNLTFLECFATTPTSKPTDERFDSDARNFLGNFVLSMISPDTERQVIGGLESFDVLKGNFRLLLSRNSHVRDRAQANLKRLLSQEKDSHFKLPRFSVIAETELTDYFVGTQVQVAVTYKTCSLWDLFCLVFIFMLDEVSHVSSRTKEELT